MKKLLCHSCAEKLKDYHPIKYALGKCDNCGTYTGVAECQRKHYDMPEGFDKIFGNKKSS